MEALLEAIALAITSVVVVYLCFSRLKDLHRFEELTEKVNDLNKRIERNGNLDDQKS